MSLVTELQLSEQQRHVDASNNIQPFLSSPSDDTTNLDQTQKP